MLMIPTFEDINQAAYRIQPYIHRTPILQSSTISAMVGADLFFKCENFQKVGAFKARGAFNAIMALPQEIAMRGVVAHSSGNHASAVALAARTRGIPAHIIMPDNSPAVKKASTQRYGATVYFCGPTQSDRETMAQEVLERTQAEFIHPYDNHFVIAGQGTAAKELLEDIADLNYVLAPVSGGGLLSGTALSTKALSSAYTIGCEPAEADDAFRSLRDGMIYPAITPPRTICDGLRTSLCERTFTIIRENVHAIYTVKETEILDAMRLVWDILKIIIEPSCAVPLAVVLNKKDFFRGKRLGIILTGGNVDITSVPFT